MIVLVVSAFVPWPEFDFAHRKYDQLNNNLSSCSLLKINVVQFYRFAIIKVLAVLGQLQSIVQIVQCRLIELIARRT